MKKNWLMLWLLVVMFIFVSTLPASAGTPEGRAKIRIVEFGFRPRSPTIHIGNTIRWRNQGDLTHTATSISGEWDSGNLDPGEAFDFDFKEVGTFVYRCRIHPSMRARIIVED